MRLTSITGPTGVSRAQYARRSRHMSSGPRAQAMLYHIRRRCTWAHKWYATFLPLYSELRRCIVSNRSCISIADLLILRSHFGRGRWTRTRSSSGPSPVAAAGASLLSPLCPGSFFSMMWPRDVDPCASMYERMRIYLNSTRMKTRLRR